MTAMGGDGTAITGAARSLVVQLRRRDLSPRVREWLEMVKAAGYRRALR